MVAKDLLDVEKIRTDLVEMGSESVSERMSRHSVGQFQEQFMLTDSFVDPSGIERLSGIGVLGKEPFERTAYRSERFLDGGI